MTSQFVTKKGDLNFFPFGKLRESVGSLQQADLVVFTKYNLGSTKSSGVASVLPIIKKHRVPYVYSETHSSLIRYSLKGGSPCRWGSPAIIKIMPMEQKLFSFCGIGDPLSFKCTTQPYQHQIIQQTTFQDHYNYHYNETKFLTSLQVLYKEFHFTGLLTTQKDFVKIKNLSGSFLVWCHQAGLSFFIIDIEMHVADEDFVLEQIKNLIL